MSQNLKADDLNLLVSLSCPNPQWEHVKFSFEDSLVETRKYSDSYNKPNIIHVKAVLVADEGYPSVVLYEQVLEKDLSDTDELVKCWEYYKERLGHRMVETVEGDILVSAKLEEDNYNHIIHAEYTLVDLRHHGCYTSVRYALDLDNARRRHSWFSGADDIFEAAKVQALKEYLRVGVPAHHRGLLANPNIFK